VYEKCLQECRAGKKKARLAAAAVAVSLIIHLALLATYKVNNLREIQAIKRLSPHQNIVKLEEVLFDPPTGRLALVFELLEGNLYELIKGKTPVPNQCDAARNVVTHSSQLP
jgi:serine/threonine protein kinase